MMFLSSELKARTNEKIPFFNLVVDSFLCLFISSFETGVDAAPNSNKVEMGYGEKRGMEKQQCPQYLGSSI